MKKLILCFLVSTLTFCSNGGVDNKDVSNNVNTLLIDRMRGEIFKRITVDGSLENSFWNFWFKNNKAELVLIYQPSNNCFEYSVGSLKDYLIQSSEIDRLVFTYLDDNTRVFTYEVVSETPFIIDQYQNNILAHKLRLSSLNEMNEISGSSDFSCCETNCILFIN